MVKKTANNELVFLPLGGVGEIGRNFALYGFGSAKDRKWLIVDCGISFPNEQLPGIEVVLPDIDFAISLGDSLMAIIITHVHEDHFGALGDVWRYLKVPVYATKFAHEMIERKAQRYPGWKQIDLRLAQPKTEIDLAPFAIEYIPVPHSIPESNALVIRTPDCLVVHTGDWKIDPCPGVGEPLALERLKALGDQGVRALICDSTNANKSGVSISERDVAETLSDIIARAPQLVGTTMFSSHVGRLRALAKAAHSAGRRVVIAGRALEQVIVAAGESGYLDDLEPFLLPNEAFDIPRNKKLVICTGSQGERRAALNRISRNQHPSVRLISGDWMIFSSRVIPGNERDVGDLINNLVLKGIRVITEDDFPVHVTGHPRQGELTQIYQALRPELLVPVHGEPRHLHAHEQFAKSQGITTVLRGLDGDLFTIFPKANVTTGFVEITPWVRDGSVVGRLGQIGVRERRKLAYSGCIAVSLVITDDHKSVLPMECRLLGLPDYDNDGRPLAPIVVRAIKEALASLPAKKRRDPAVIERAVHKAARSAVFKVWDKKPICEVMITRAR